MAVAVSRFLDWFWLRSAARAVRGGGAPSPRLLELAGRAALACEAAVRIERPAEPFAHAGNDAVAAELYRQAVHWALLAHEELASPPAPSPDPPADVKDATEAAGLALLLERGDRALLLRAAGGEARLAAFEKELGRTSYREFAELSPDAQRALVERLAVFAQELVDPLASLERQLERIWVRRALHVLGAVLLLAGLVFGVRQVMRHFERQHDLAVNAKWTASTLYDAGGCPSPAQQCPGGENYFFHTSQQDDPSVTFDLGGDHRVAAVEVDNRLDCCAERADPLAVAVSADGRRWKEVARHDGEFNTLRVEFGSVRARYVRLHVPKTDAVLHLSRVRIFP